MKKMLIYLPAVLAGAMTAGIANSADLIVAPGTTRTILATEQNMVLNRLQIGDNAKIVFAPGVDHWEVWAERAEFGENALIDARGATGENGGHGTKGRSTNTPKKYGEPGERGKPGVDGHTGVDLLFRVKVATFGGVLVDASGGQGGIGGNGGAGGKSGDARCKDRAKARNGERGGNGGAGGDGGRGGMIEFRYTSAAGGFVEQREDEIRELTLPGINFVSEGGLGNAAGIPGKGGAGGHGNSACIPKMGGGKRGSNGAKGEAGTPGTPGTITIIKDDFKSAPFPSDDDLKKKEDPKYYEDPAYP